MFKYQAHISRTSWHFLMPHTSIPSFHAVSHALICTICKLCKSQTTHRGTKCFHTGSSTSWPALPLFSRLSIRGAPWAAEQARPRVPARCLEAAFSQGCYEGKRRFLHGSADGSCSPSRSVQAAAFRRESPRGACDCQPVDGHATTQRHNANVCALSCTHTGAFMCINSLYYIPWIPPAGLYTIGYSTDRKSQFTCLPTSPLGKRNTPESSSRLAHGAWCLQGEPYCLYFFPALFLFQSSNPGSLL